MKRIKIFTLILFCCSAVAFAGCKLYERVMTDHQAPVISGGEEPLQISVADTEDKLLEGMTAEDDRDGDVTDSLVVQEISGFDEENQRTVTYAAVDRSGNVGYSSRTITYTDYQAPVFAMSSPLRFPMGTSFNICEGLTASSSLDGDLTSNIKYTLDRTVSNSAAGTYQAEFRVMDSAGRTSYLTTEIEVYDPTAERINVTLNTYLLYLKVNDPFDPAGYYAGADRGDTLEIQSTVNTASAGTYYVDYIVSDAQSQSSGKSRMVVVVSE